MKFNKTINVLKFYLLLILTQHNRYVFNIHPLKIIRTEISMTSFITTTYPRMVLTLIYHKHIIDK